jgi:hypothetical protein
MYLVDMLARTSGFSLMVITFGRQALYVVYGVGYSCLGVQIDASYLISAT